MSKTAEIFSDFEVYKYSRAPIVTKLLGASLFLHLIMGAVVALSPTVRDVLFLSGILSDTAFVDKAYKKTNIAEDVTIIDAGKFKYPEGYFNKNQEPQQQAKVVEKPKPKPTPKKDKDQIAKNKKDKKEVAKNNEEQGNNDGEKDMDNYGPVEFNKRPLKDFGADVKKLVDDGKIEIDQPFEVLITGGLNSKGRLTGASYRVISGDKEMNRIVAGLMAAINDSGLFAQLVKANDDKPLKSISFRVKRDASTFNAVLDSKVESQDKARAIASALGLTFTLVKASRAGKDEAALMQRTRATSSGDRFTVSFNMPNAQADAMIQRQLTLAKQERGK